MSGSGHDEGPVRGMGRQLVQQLPLLVVLVVLWLLLWRSVTPIDVLMGIVIAVLVTRVFELPPVRLSGRFNPWWFLIYLIIFFGEVVAGSVDVAAKAFRPGPPVRSSVIEVRLVTRSDFVMTLTGITLSLIPGSFVLEVDRTTSTLFLHTIGTHEDGAIDRVREHALRTERRILHAVGSREEYERSLHERSSA